MGNKKKTVPLPRSSCFTKEDTIKVETQIHSRSVKMPAIHEFDSSNVRIILKLTYIIKIMDNVIVKLAHSSRVMTTSSYIK